MGMTYNAHPLPGCDESGNTNHEPNSREHSVATPCVAQSNKDSGDHAPKNAGKTEASGKDDARSVAVAYGPADEVGMGLMTKGPFNCMNNLGER